LGLFGRIALPRLPPAVKLAQFLTMAAQKALRANCKPCPPANLDRLGAVAAFVLDLRRLAGLCVWAGMIGYYLLPIVVSLY